MALRRRFLPVFKKHAPRGMARFAKSLQGPFGPAAKHSQKHKNRPEIGRFSHFNPSAEMHPFSPFSASKAPEKWLCDAICRKKQLFAGSLVSRSHSFCSFTAILEQRTFTKTLNVKGTIVQTPNLDALSPFTDKSTRQAAIRYLRALQFSSLIMELISYYAADLFQPADFIQLERRFAVPQSILLNDIIETMMQRIGLPPLLVIMTEARRMTDWGYFLAFYKNKRQTIAELNEKSLLAYQYLCKDDKKAFAHAVASCYHDILDSVRKQLAT